MPWISGHADISVLILSFLFRLDEPNLDGWQTQRLCVVWWSGQSGWSVGGALAFVEDLPVSLCPVALGERTE